jgi:hypothetical protein
MLGMPEELLFQILEVYQCISLLDVNARGGSPVSG